jgi:multidrug efflux pump subunit AcrA (membrane-fusion protein)
MTKLMIAAAMMQLVFVSCTRTAPEAHETRPALHAETGVVQPVAITERFDAPGTVRARTQTVLSSKVTGQITSLVVREGNRVRQGQTLVEVEGSDAAAQLRRAEAGETEAHRSLEEVDASIRAAESAVRSAEANLSLAEVTRKRYESLRERQSVSPQEFDEVDARYKAAASEADRARESVTALRARRSQVTARIEQAQAGVESARTMVGYLRIISPIDGIVSRRHAEAGMLATPGMPLITVEDDRTYELESIIEESRGNAVTIGQPVVVTIDAVAGDVQGRVRDIVPASDPATRTFIVKVSLVFSPAIRGVIRSGAFGRASFAAGERQALIVPESALVRRGQLTGVYVVYNNAALLRLVKAGRSFENGVEVLSGLAAGTRILTRPPSDITDGTPIEDAPEGPMP